MVEVQGFGDIDFGGPATYRVVVQGVVSPAWGDRLGDMAIVFTSEEGEPARTIIEGPIQDQAELRGLLDTLYGLHFPILKVEKTEDEA